MSKDYIVREGILDVLEITFIMNVMRKKKMRNEFWRTKMVNNRKRIVANESELRNLYDFFQNYNAKGKKIIVTIILNKLEAFFISLEK
ncbi:hypothetical protein CQA53_00325 [Helicobacter didelphidarum]|uniref:Uncharacterized protein n=1 Tax=Helicobacter didelphidarum TaxID=2040648 RepID=A0A3D8IRA2_9HELI|nr:hypothetical protein [Helicobacter didelphidarum]RDU67510.1 hypothetical protein CQA53_00325 [Helicobacter didelphidarum]